MEGLATPVLTCLRLMPSPTIGWRERTRWPAEGHDEAPPSRVACEANRLRTLVTGRRSTDKWWASCAVRRVASRTDVLRAMLAPPWGGVGRSMSARPRPDA